MSGLASLVARWGGRGQLTALLGAVGGGREAPPASPPSGRYPVPDGEAASALALARRAGHPGHLVDALGEALAGADARTRRQVVDPLGRARPPGTSAAPLLLGTGRAVQVDETTCGSAVLSMLAAAGDPVLAWWLVTGGVLAGEAGVGAAGVPLAELDRLERLARCDGSARSDGPDRGSDRGSDPGSDPGPAPLRRFHALQHAIKRATNRAGLAVAPWPGALGTPPWGSARAARFADVRYTHRVVDDGSAPGRRTVAAALDAAARGVPVPLYTGGDARAGIAAAVPRHVVLLTAAGPSAGPSTGPRAAARRCRVYEPSSGTVHTLDAAALLAGRDDDAVRAALGGWRHVCWAVLPAGRAGG